MNQRKKWLVGNRKLAKLDMGSPKLHTRSHMAGCCVFALPLCLALAACGPRQDVRLLIQPSQPLAQDCLEKLPTLLGPQVPIALVRRPRPQKGIEYEVRGPESRISVFQDFGANAIEVALNSEGSGSPEQKRDSLGLLKNVHSGVLSACNLDRAKVRVDRSCNGGTCQDPEYSGL